MSVSWGIPGTKRPYDCDLAEIIRRKERTLSEIVISYHFLPEDIAVKIENSMLNDGEEARAIMFANLFNELRRISPGELHWHAKFRERFPRLLTESNPLGKLFAFFAPVITWGYYAKKIRPNWSTDDFIQTYTGFSAMVEKHFRLVL